MAGGKTVSSRWDSSGNLEFLDVNGAIIAEFDGTNRKITIPSGSAIDLDAAHTFEDDIAIGLGTGSPADILWETEDANANALLIQLPAGGSVDVPVVVIGDTIEGDDLGQYDGVVSTTVAIHGSTATATGPSLTFKKSRGTNSAPTAVTSGDDAGSIDFYGAVAAGEYVRSVRILAETTGTVATTRGPGVLTFQTATDAAPSVLTTAMTISAAQLVTVAAGLTVTTGDLTISAAAAELKATAGNVRLGGAGAFAMTQPRGAVIMSGTSLAGIAPAGAIATAGAVFSSDTVVQKIIANGTVSNVET